MAEKKLAGARVLMVIAPDQFRDEELLTPQGILRQHGAEVSVACKELGEAKGMLGARVKPDTKLAAVDPAQYDAVIVVGGMGSPTYLWDDGDLHRILQDMNRANKVVAGICLSGAALARAGVLENKAATVWPMPESIDALAKGKAKYKKEPVVEDGRTITADGPEAASKFGEAVAEALAQAATRV